MCMCMGLEWSYLHKQSSASMCMVRYPPFPNTKSSYPRGSAQPLWPRVLGRFAELRRKSAIDNGDPCKSAALFDKGGRQATEYEAAPDRSAHLIPCPCQV